MISHNTLLVLTRLLFVVQKEQKKPKFLLAKFFTIMKMSIKKMFRYIIKRKSS